MAGRRRGNPDKGAGRLTPGIAKGPFRVADRGMGCGSGNRNLRFAMWSSIRGVVTGRESVPAQEADLDGVADDVGTGPQAELLGDAGAVGLDRLDAQEQ